MTSWTLGLFFIFLVTVIWAAASFLTQYIYSNLDFESPFLITYIYSTLFALYLPVWYFSAAMGWVKTPRWRRRINNNNNSINSNSISKKYIETNDRISNPLNADGEAIVQTTATISSSSSSSPPPTSHTIPRKSGGAAGTNSNSYGSTDVNDDDTMDILCCSKDYEGR